jgi:chloramphenicol 3-O-phosphotransferase
MARLSNKSAQRIASLFNSITVAETMRARVDADGKRVYNWDVWTDAIAKAALSLYEEFGIHAVGVESAIEDYTARKLDREHRARMDALALRVSMAAEQRAGIGA